MITRLLIAVTAAMLLLAACSGEDAAETSPSPTRVAPATAPGAATPPAPGASPTDSAPADADSAEPSVTITAVDYAFEGVPATIAAGSRLALTNDSDAEAHELVAFRLADDDERSVEQILQESSEDNPPGVFAGVLVAPPGADGFAPEGPVVLDQPGRYLFICAIPTGADPAALAEVAASGGTAADLEGGPPHFVNGMVAETVVG